MALYEQLLEKMDGHQYSNYFTCCCIFHQDSSPSLFVYEDGWYRCAACGAKGRLEYLAKKLGHHQFSVTQSQSKVQVLPQWRRWVQQWDSLEGIVEHAHYSLTKFHAIDKYLKRRKIYEYVTKGKLGVLDGYLVIPIFSSDSRIVDVVVRRLSASSSTRYVVQPILHSDKRPLFVPNWQRLEQAENIYCVFGMLDAISLELCGLPVVTGITGKAVPVEQLQELHKRIVIVPDLGEEDDAHKIANKLGWRGRVKELKYPDGCKDPNDVFMFQGKEELVSLLQ